ncbi:MAG: DUF6036 family nucleotidyltransferase [Thermoplasmatota archaeon]
MKERRKFNTDELMKMLEKVSISLKRTVSCTLIGGLAMMYHGAKETTKDIDMVFSKGKEIEHFIHTVSKMGFSPNPGLTEDYLDLKAHAIYISDDGYMLDLFLSRVLNGFYLTDNMKKRSKTIHLEGNLEVKVLSPVDIFLFKSITLREDDLLDMAYLAPMIKDWVALENELLFMRHDYRLLSRFNERMKDLETQYQLEVPITSDIENLCKMAYVKMAILGVLQNEPRDKTSIFQGLDEGEVQDLERALKELVNDGIIFDRDGMVSMKHHPAGKRISS